MLCIRIRLFSGHKQLYIRSQIVLQIVLRRNDYKIRIWTLYEPHELLKFLHDVEASQGLDRSKKTHWGPRALDLDILFYDDIVLDDEELTIPHPDMGNRDFVMKPLAELAPFYRHPLTKKTVAMMAAAPMEEHIVS